MLICPQDCHLCDRPDCRTAGSEPTGEPVAECVECGAVRATGRVAIAQVVIRTAQHLAVLVPADRMLMLITRERAKAPPARRRA